jgi:hypothetical protein
VTSILRARRVATQRPPDRASPRAPAAQLRTFPSSRSSLKPIGGTNLRPSKGSLSDFAAFSYASREDLPIRAWNGSKGKDGQREDGPKGESVRRKGGGKAATEEEIEDTPFSQLVKAAAFMKNQEERVSGASDVAIGGERTEKRISGEKKSRKRRLRGELKEADRSIGKPAKKKRLAELGEAVGSAFQLQDDVAPGQGRHVASPSPLVGFFKKRKEGKRKVKLSKRGEQMDLGSPRRARASPDTDGAERSSEGDKKSSEESAKASEEVRKPFVEAELDLKKQKKRKRIDGFKGQENPQKTGGKEDNGVVKPSGSPEFGTMTERGSGSPPAATSPKVERMGKTRRKVRPPRKWSPGFDGEGSDRDNETIRTKPCRDTRLSAEANAGRGASPEEIGSPRKLQFDGAKEGKESARERGKGDGIGRAEESEAGKEVMRNSFKVDRGDANGPANKEEESEATKPASERLNGAATGEGKASQENGGRETGEQGREATCAADSKTDEKRILVTPFVSEAFERADTSEGMRKAAGAAQPVGLGRGLEGRARSRSGKRSGW